MAKIDNKKLHKPLKIKSSNSKSEKILSSKMSTKSSIFATPTLNIITIFILCSTYQILVVATNGSQFTPRPNDRREALGIIIGGNDPPSPQNCPPPPPPPAPCPPPPSLPPTMATPPTTPPSLPPKPAPTTPPPSLPPKPTPTTPPPSLPPKPTPTTPPPSPFGLSQRVQIATKVINQFLKGVDGDPCNIKSNRNFCSNSNFRCALLKKYNQQALYGVQFNECKIMGQNITLENFIDKLPDISFFHANSNFLQGNIPVLSHLPYLFELDLSNNKYTGKFPVNVLGASQLTFLDLRFNRFEGPIPPEIFNLRVLALFINNNNFNMDLPSNLGSTPAAFITFANNYFTGPIPKSIGQACKTLLEILFLNNRLSGCLPYEIGRLKKVRVFDVSKNILTGPIPRSFACLGKMEYLQLANNEFYGPVPEEVCMLPLLRKLNLCGNYFTQVGPVCMALMRKGVLEVKDNCVLGLPGQKSPEVCAEFFNRPKYCDEGKMLLNHVPCKKTASYLKNFEMSSGGAPDPQPPVTYGALSPDFN